MDILYLIDRLKNLISNSRHIPLANQVMIKEAEILEIIDQMYQAIPEEIKQAKRIVQEQERILAQATATAKNMQAHARSEIEKAMRRESLLRTAEERSQEILRLATEQAQMQMRRTEERCEQLKIDADGYVSETLRNLREHLVNVETEIERTVLSIEKGLESLDNRPNSQNSEGDDEAVDPASAVPPSRLPRRAALAADTMGAGPDYG